MNADKNGLGGYLGTAQCAKVNRRTPIDRIAD